MLRKTVKNLMLILGFNTTVDQLAVTTIVR